jgi:hypothetical protein
MHWCDPWGDAPPIGRPTRAAWGARGPSRDTSGTTRRGSSRPRSDVAGDRGRLGHTKGHGGLTMAESHMPRECRSMSNVARRCQVRVVSTEPWLICESGGVRFVLPEARAVDGSTAEGGSVLIPEWAFNELAAARACIDAVTRASRIPTTPPGPEGRRSAAVSAGTSGTHRPPLGCPPGRGRRRA